MPTVFVMIVALALLFIAGLAHINWRLKTMSDKTAELIATVGSLTTVVESAVAALNGQTDNTEALIRAAVAAALADDAASDAQTEAAVNAAIDEAIAAVRAQTDALAAAIPAGTVAEDEEPAPAETVEGGEGADSVEAGDAGDDSLPAGGDTVEG